MKNKRGFLPVLTLPIIIAILVFAILVIGGLFIFISVNKFALIGGALVVLSLIFGFRGEFNKTKAWFLGIIIVVGLLFVLGGNVLQQVTGVSTYEDNQGDTHWLIEGVATGVDEGYTFRSLPDELTDSEGNKVVPKEEATIYISKSESFCEYQLNKVELRKAFGIIKLDYYELKAPERVALIKVRDDSGNEKIIDGTITRTETFFDNGGELKFSSLGLQVGKRDCQEGSNVAIVIVDGISEVKDKQDLENTFNAIKIFKPLTYFQKESRDNTAFLSNFEDFSVRGTERFIGDVEIGNVNYVIDADAKYYNSVIVTPPKSANPVIESINVQEDINNGDTASVVLEIRNKGDKGSIVIDASTEFGDISPTSKNAILNDDLSSVFTLKVPESESNNNDLCFFVESIDGKNSDRECESFNVKERDKDIEEFCGDGTCQSNEAFTTCPEDCEKEVTCALDSDCSEGFKCIEGECEREELECGFGQVFSSETKVVGKGFLGVGKLVGLTDTITEEKCVTAGWIIWAIMGLLIAILGATAIVVNRKKWNQIVKE